MTLFPGFKGSRNEKEINSSKKPDTLKNLKKKQKRFFSYLAAQQRDQVFGFFVLENAKLKDVLQRPRRRSANLGRD